MSYGNRKRKLKIVYPPLWLWAIKSELLPLLKKPEKLKKIVLASWKAVLYIAMWFLHD